MLHGACDAVVLELDCKHCDEVAASILNHELTVEREDELVASLVRCVWLELKLLYIVRRELGEEYGCGLVPYICGVRRGETFSHGVEILHIAAHGNGFLHESFLNVLVDIVDESVVARVIDHGRVELCLCVVVLLKDVIVHSLLVILLARLIPYALRNEVVVENVFHIPLRNDSRRQRRLARDDGHCKEEKNHLDHPCEGGETRPSHPCEGEILSRKEGKVLMHFLYLIRYWR